MLRLLTACLALLLSAGVAHAQEKGKNVTLRWFGQSFFQLETPGGARIVFDPHAIEEYGQHYVTADYALISHPHEDHNQVLILANRQEVKVLQGLRGQGRRLTWNNIDTKFKDAHIRTLPASAGTYHDRYKGEKRGLNAVFIVDVAGLRIVHLGDLGHLLTDEQVKALGEVDVLMIPIGGIYTINGGEAKEVVEQIKPKRFVVPMHYGTKVYDYLLPPDEFFDGQENVKNMTDTNELVIPVDEKPGKGPVIAQLGWKR